ncbi:hypothetical protein M5D96_011203 [Drosophila gunungcola]|uniref:Uncharacterized protein n=1 Tax=Drosophila gunungcola TaxID=103775 RepID=A0A9Q0BKM7_9MUSC|nr:hypothetical protein M5D96_011203 [Drosophila gunungcola]
MKWRKGTDPLTNKKAPPWEAWEHPKDTLVSTPPFNTDYMSTLARSPDASIVVCCDVPEAFEPQAEDDEEEEPTTLTVARLARQQVDDGDEPGTSTTHVLVGAWLHVQDRHSFAPGHLQQCLWEAQPEANQTWEDFAGDIAPAPEDSEPESGLSSQHEDSDDERDDVLDIHTRSPRGARTRGC